MKIVRCARGGPYLCVYVDWFILILRWDDARDLRLWLLHQPWRMQLPLRRWRLADSARVLQRLPPLPGRVGRGGCHLGCSSSAATSPGFGTEGTRCDNGTARHVVITRC